MPFMTAVLAAASVAVVPWAGPPSHGVSVEEQFAPARAGAGGAVTYDLGAVPEGSRVKVVERTDARGTRIELRVSGVEAGRGFGAHVHQKPCGADPEASGPHYQHRVDPVQPSVDPAYANPRNEAWLDFTTDGRGQGASGTRVAWHFRAGGAYSVVVHEHLTETGPGHAGMAGERLACVNVPFR
ncbi:superoxide dismutase family protein [Streptomyces stramineus]|uniref:Superoxide dismutase n=1 Tax=Streptomyces stramineus TaxID=173861 RepID=A0ABP3KEC9_9ACTN